MGLVTMHAYPLKHCQASHRVTIGNVLSAAASQGFVREVAPFVHTAQRDGKPIRIDETNAITCGGNRRGLRFVRDCTLGPEHLLRPGSARDQRPERQHGPRLDQLGPGPDHGRTAGR